MTRTLKSLILSTAALGGLVVAPPAAAQGIPVHDNAALIQHIAQVSHTVTMIQQGLKQINQAKQTFDSLNKLTHINSIGQLLDNANVRNILPPEIREVTALLSGNHAQQGALGALADQIKTTYGLVLHFPASQTDQNYADGLNNANNAASTMLAFGSNTMNIADMRTRGLSQLQSALDSATDPKTVLDLTARINAQIAQGQNDLLKVQAVRLSQDADRELRTNQFLAQQAQARSAYIEAKRTVQ